MSCRIELTRRKGEHMLDFIAEPLQEEQLIVFKVGGWGILWFQVGPPIRLGDQITGQPVCKHLVGPHCRVVVKLLRRIFVPIAGETGVRSGKAAHLPRSDELLGIIEHGLMAAANHLQMFVPLKQSLELGADHGLLDSTTEGCLFFLGYRTYFFGDLSLLVGRVDRLSWSRSPFNRSPGHRSRRRRGRRRWRGRRWCFRF